jgi:integrase
MAGKQAKLLTEAQVTDCLAHVVQSRHETRNRVMLMLSVKAGLRAGEIAALTWSMVSDARGRIGETIELEDRIAKKGSGRTIPLHPELRKALRELKRSCDGEGTIVQSERGGAMSAASVVNWFAELYRALRLVGCSSHSGRRTFITNAARRVHRAGGSLRDVQELAGHRSISMTQRYIEGDSEAKRRLVALL